MITSQLCLIVVFSWRAMMAKQSSAHALLDESTVGTNQVIQLMMKSPFRSYGMDNMMTLVAKEKKK